MTKYIINESYHGYEKITIDNISEAEKPDSMHVIIIDKKCDDDLPKYYWFIDKALRAHNRILLISINDQNRSFKPLASLLVKFNNYDIYEVENKELLSADYLSKLEIREPDFAEVQTYIGGDITADSDMDTILFGIESLLYEGNDEALKKYLEENIITLESMTTSINSMRKTCDIFNSNELINEVKSLKENEKRLNRTIDEKEESLKNIKHDRDKFKVDAETMHRENTKLQEKVANSQEQATHTSTITTFKTTSTQLLKGNKTKIVLYFKEISYVRYMNTLVTVLKDHLDRMKLKTKLLIYDTNSGMYDMYKPLRVVTGNDYVSDKGILINKVAKFVVAEPSQMIIEDVLVSDQAFDVVIVYDRMHTLNDVVEGNLVTKFFVINSKNDYDKLKGTLKISDTSFVITDASSTINIGSDWKVNGERKFLDIPTIPDYPKKNMLSPESFRSRSYMKQATALTQQPLIDTILSKSRINTLNAHA